MHIIDYEQYREHKLHGSPDFPYITYLCSIPKDFKFVPLHWHEEIELVYIKKGRGVVHVDLERYEVQEKDIVLILPGQLHSIEQYARESMEYETILFHLNMLMGKTSDICSRVYFKPLLHGISNLPQIISPQLSWYQAFASCIDEADEICKYYPMAYPLAIKSKLFQMFYILFYNDTKPLPKTRPQKSLRQAKYILDYITQHYTEHLSIEDMAKACSLSESHFMKFFKSAFGMTFTEYLNDYRLCIAASEIRGSEHSISTIAAACGLDNTSYFNRLFKRKFHVTPTQYRLDAQKKPSSFVQPSLELQ